MKAESENDNRWKKDVKKKREREREWKAWMKKRQKNWEVKIDHRGRKGGKKSEIEYVRKK